MQRRGFLGLLGSAALAPVLPRMPVAAVAQGTARRAGYSGLLYGMAKFHAQTQPGLTAADLMPRLGVSATKAQSLMGELMAKGIVSPMATMTRAATSQHPSSEVTQTVTDKIKSATDQIDRIADACSEGGQADTKEISDGQI